MHGQNHIKIALSVRDRVSDLCGNVR